jgi:hypothetical protein
LHAFPKKNGVKNTWRPPGDLKKLCHAKQSVSRQSEPTAFS